MTSIMRRLKKVMALSNSSNPGEAAAALHQAEVMMKRYGLSQLDVELSEIKESPFALETAQLSKSDAYLIAIVKEALGVQCILSEFPKTRGIIRPAAKLVFIGEAYRIEIAQYVFVQLRRQLKKSIKKTLDDLLVSVGQSKGDLRVTAKMRDAYAAQWCNSVFDKVKLLSPTRSHLIDEYVSRKHKLGKAKTFQPNSSENPQGNTIVNYMARKGHEDGKTVQIHTGLDTAESVAPLAIKG